MASNPIPGPQQGLPAKRMTEDEWWEFVFSLYGSAKEEFAAVGGTEAWLDYVRHGDQASE